MYLALVADAPPCACGCGKPVRPRATDPDAFRRSGNRKYRLYRHGHDKRPSNWQHELSTPERQAILGTLLGDSSIHLPGNRSTNPRLVANHGVVQRQWAEHKAALLAPLNVRVTEAVNGGHGDRVVRMATSCLPCLEPIRRLVAPDGEKRPSRAWLDGLGGLGLAWWIGDDGSSGTGNSPGFHLHTEGFRRDDVELIADWFRDTYGSVTVGKVRPYLYVSAAARRAFLPLVEPHLPACMAYKLKSCRLGPIGQGHRRYEDGVRDEALRLVCDEGMTPGGAARRIGVNRLTVVRWLGPDLTRKHGRPYSRSTRPSRRTP